MSNPLADALLPDDREDRQVNRTGTVTSTSPLEVAVAGETGLPAARLASYTPTVGDTVRIEQSGSDYLILGRIITGG